MVVRLYISITMVRILMLTPLMLVLIYYILQKGRRNKENVKFIGIPNFILGFILFSLIPTFKLLSAENINIINNFSHYLLIIAMAGIGLKITFQDIFSHGKSALIVGSSTFIIQILMSSIGITYLL